MERKNDIDALKKWLQNASEQESAPVHEDIWTAIAPQIAPSRRRKRVVVFWLWVTLGLSITAGFAWFLASKIHYFDKKTTIVRTQSAQESVKTTEKRVNTEGSIFTDSVAGSVDYRAKNQASPQVSLVEGQQKLSTSENLKANDLPPLETNDLSPLKANDLSTLKTPSRQTVAQYRPNTEGDVSTVKMTEIPYFSKEKIAATTSQNTLGNTLENTLQNTPQNTAQMLDDATLQMPTALVYDTNSAIDARRKMAFEETGLLPSISNKALIIRAKNLNFPFVKPAHKAAKWQSFVGANGTSVALLIQPDRADRYLVEPLSASEEQMEKSYALSAFWGIENRFLNRFLMRFQTNFGYEKHTANYRLFEIDRPEYQTSLLAQNRLLVETTYKNSVVKLNRTVWSPSLECGFKFLPKINRASGFYVGATFGHEFSKFDGQNGQNDWYFALKSNLELNLERHNRFQGFVTALWMPQSVKWLHFSSTTMQLGAGVRWNLR